MPDHPKWRVRLAGVLCLLALGAAPSARAATQYEIQPSLIVAGGYDDNLLFNGQGGDNIGRGAFRVRAQIYDRLWNFTGDVAASVYGFANNGKILPVGESTLRFNAALGHFDDITAAVRVRGADDPLTLAQVGMLSKAQGAAIGFRSSVEEVHQFDARWSLSSGAAFDGVRRLEPAFADRSGEAASLAMAPRLQLTRALQIEVAVEGRLFLANGITGEAIGALPGVRYRLARRTFLKASGGALIFNDAVGSLAYPVARADLNWDDREVGVAVTAAQDLTVPVGRAGVISAQLLEGIVHYGRHAWELRARAGFYRDRPSPRATEWVPGYGAEAGAFYQVASFVWLGVTALRFERLATQFEPSMARNAVYLRLDLTSGRP